MAWWNKSSKKIEVAEVKNISPTLEAQSSLYIGNGKIGYNPILHDVFDGEKNSGELGAVYDTLPDHLRLRLRAYDMNLKTDIVKVITGKFFKWVVGSGLKLQAEPNEVVLGLSNITEDLPVFKKNVEALFNLYASSSYSDYHKKDYLHEKASEAFKAAFLGGDCLCILRLDSYGVNIQVLDGQQCESPLDETLKENGNKIIKGIELNAKGEHVAFWIKAEDENSVITHKRIKARNSNGNLVAWMIYGDKARIDHQRGIPVISSILEKIAKLDRYVEASVTKAEQTANVVYAFKHNTNSTGENILKESLTSKRNNVDGIPESVFEQNGKISQAFRQSVSGVVLNLTPDSDIAALSTQSEATFDNFFRAVFVVLCAAVDIPEEVALQKYEQNYSSSRAAINGWEHIIEIYRQKFAKKFYEPFYRLWLEHSILTDKIKSNGFLVAKTNNDFMALEAYFSSRFSGKKMPHIDPLKEAKAMRAMLGDDTVPLISRDQATEALGVGDWNENFKKSLQESEIIPIPKENAEEQNNSSKPAVERGPKS